MYAQYDFAAFSVNFIDGCFGAIDAISKAYTRTIEILTSDRAIAGYRLAFYVSRNIIEIGWLIIVATIATVQHYLNNRRNVTTPQDRWNAAIVPHPTTDDDQPITLTLPPATDDEPAATIDVEVVTLASPLATEVAEEVADVVSSEPDYSAMNLVSLRKECLKQGCHGAARWNKEKCLKVLTAA